MNAAGVTTICGGGVDEPWTGTGRAGTFAASLEMTRIASSVPGPAGAYVTVTAWLPPFAMLKTAGTSETAASSELIPLTSRTSVPVLRTRSTKLREAPANTLPKSRAGVSTAIIGTGVTWSVTVWATDGRSGSFVPTITAPS